MGPSIRFCRAKNGAPAAKVGGIIALALSACLGFQYTALASTAIVPDDFSTLQVAIDSGVDTVLIRAGTYPERPVVDRAVALLGIGTPQRPRLAGLHIYNSNFRAPSLSVGRIDISGLVAQKTVTWQPRNLQLSFTEC